ncbi:hypothetical protein [Nocardioides sp. YIM 152588]|uniref:hypothetical protein n=1 Tax=Nocardioides sp. YIM 152588 TaxID=3158259 RepID=UPI0032E398EF
MEQQPARRTPPVHVWVDTTMRWGPSSLPGILLTWRRTTPREGVVVWQGLCVFALVPPPRSPGDLVVYQQWVDAAHIQPMAAQDPPRARG